MTKKCTKIYNARAQLLFHSLNLLFGGVFVAVAVVVCLSSLIGKIFVYKHFFCYLNVQNVKQNYSLFHQPIVLWFAFE